MIVTLICFIWGTICLSILCSVVAYKAGKHKPAKVTAKETTEENDSINWPNVYLMEQAIYGRTFHHDGAPEPHDTQPVTKLVESGEVDYSGWYRALKDSKTLEEIHMVETMARQTIECMLESARNENRLELTQIDNDKCDVLFDIVRECREKTKLLERKEKIWREVMTNADLS